MAHAIANIEAKALRAGAPGGGETPPGARNARAPAADATDDGSAAGGWQGLVAQLDGPLKYVRSLSLFSVVAVIGMAFFQFNQWSIEKTLDRAKTDYDLATQTFDDVVKTLANAQKLQEILFFTYRGAAGAPPERAPFYVHQAQAVYKDYTTARMELRTGMDRLIYRAQLHIDWASDLDADQTLSSNRYRFDPISETGLDAAHFDCADPRSVPNYDRFADLTAITVGDMVVDWRSVKHQLVVFYHCFDAIHDLLFPVRVWASGDAPESPRPLPTQADAGALSVRVLPIMDKQVLRLNGISMLALTRIEQIRRLNALPSFLDYYLRNRDRIVINHS